LHRFLVTATEMKLDLPLLQSGMYYLRLSKQSKTLKLLQP
jgi:hypothetical protein